MKVIRFQVPFYWDGKVRYEPGKLYPVNDETRRQVAAGNAELIDAPDELQQRAAAPGIVELVEPVPLPDLAALRAQLELAQAEAAAAMSAAEAKAAIAANLSAQVDAFDAAFCAELDAARLQTASPVAT